MHTITMPTRKGGPLTVTFDSDRPGCLWYLRAEGSAGEVIFDPSADTLPDPGGRPAWFDDLEPSERSKLLDAVRAAGATFSQ